MVSFAQIFFKIIFLILFIYFLLEIQKKSQYLQIINIIRNKITKQKTETLLSGKHWMLQYRYDFLLYSTSLNRKKGIAIQVLSKKMTSFE